MELRGLAALVMVVGLAPGAAVAQTAAGSAADRGPGDSEIGTPGTTDVRPRAPHGSANVGVGARIGGGVAYADGVPDAWLFRFDYEAFLYIAPRGTVGGLFGFLTGFDYWKSSNTTDNWGLGLPTAFVVGMRAVAVRGLVGFGFNALTIDQVADDTGLGWCAPMAIANFGLDVHGWTVMADARVSRRWQFGADDFTQWMFSVMVGATLEPKHNRRFFEGPAPGQR
jgi:hypothetical protein